MKKNSRKEATFLSRLVAYFIDVFLISVLATLLSYPFVNAEKSKDISKNESDIAEQFVNNEINEKQYTELMIDVVYQDYKNNGLVYIVTIILEILYFGMYQFYKKGQTIGKKLLKLRVKSDKGDLTMNQLLFRSLIIDSTLLNIFVFVFMLFTSKNVFFYGMMTFSFIEYLILFISFIMIKFRNDRKGLHDVMFNTIVVYNEEMVK